MYEHRSASRKTRHCLFSISSQEESAFHCQYHVFSVPSLQICAVFHFFYFVNLPLFISFRYLSQFLFYFPSFFCLFVNIKILNLRYGCCLKLLLQGSSTALQSHLTKRRHSTSILQGQVKSNLYTFFTVQILPFPHSSTICVCSVTSFSLIHFLSPVYALLIIYLDSFVHYHWVLSPWNHRVVHISSRITPSANGILFDCRICRADV